MAAWSSAGANVMPRAATPPPCGAPFEADTDYFGKGPQTAMVNYRVKDLDDILKQLRKADAHIDEKIEESEYDRFAWVTDPEGNRIELWQPPTDEA